MNSYGPGPHVNVPVATKDSPGNNLGAWQGLTIKEILEKVDLANIIMDDDKKDLSMSGVINPESAFLGPKLWNRSIPVPLTQDNEDITVMNIDDFLSENGFDLNEPASPTTTSPRSSSDMETDFTTMEIAPQKQQSNKRPVPTEEKLEVSDQGKKSMESSDNAFLYAESKRIRLEREKEERLKNKYHNEIEFSPRELALATVPGSHFDPRERSFAPDELRPHPIIRKRKKSFTPADRKDSKYWEKREKNNVAARRSREARRLKENQIALRTAYLERENAKLQAALEQAKADNMELVTEKQILMEKLQHCGPK